MRLAVLFWLVVVTVCGVRASEALILYADTDSKAVRIATLELKLAIEHNQTLEGLLGQYGVQPAMRRFGRFYAVALSPIRSQEARTALTIALEARYGDLFVIANPSDRLQAPSSASKPTTTPFFGERMAMMDWVWLTLWVLSVVGLSASIRQRRKIARLSREQAHLQRDQSRMEGEIKTMQGENQRV